VNGVSVGLRVLEALLSTGDRAIHVTLFLLLFYGEHIAHKGSVNQDQVCVCVRARTCTRPVFLKTT